MSPFVSVMVVALVIWAGLFLYLLRLDARITEATRRLSEAGSHPAADAPAAVIETRVPAEPQTRASSGG